MDRPGDNPIWEPSTERIAGTRMSGFMRAAGEHWGRPFADYDALYRWSMEEPARFWLCVWEFCQVIGERGSDAVLLDPERMPGARWFPDARLNFAQNLLRLRDDSDAMVFWGEDRVKRRVSRRELYSQVARLAAALRAAGVVPGDRIAAYMPNMPETVVAMLAAASVGAIFSSCSPDFGVQGVLDRLGQIEPRILIAADGYYYNGKTVDLLEKIGQIAEKLPTLRDVVIVPYAGEAGDLGGIRAAKTLAGFVAPYEEQTDIEFEQLPFDHPLCILYSSGTTGVPKCIVHGAGGTLLQHLKEHQLHGDVKPGDRVFYFTTCGWMMWNWLVSGLASGATLLLYDGSPFAGSGSILFDYADAEDMTHFGTSAKYIDACAKQNIAPCKTHRLEALRTIFSTGSPLAPDGFDYVYRSIKRDVQLASISGGTDLVSCFVLGCPILPVWRGEIQCRGLGMAVEVWDENGRQVRGQKGEMVCVKPFPVMPIGFWNDPDGTKYHAAYFENYPNVWCHGDWVELTDHDGVIIYGRSDATLNPGGVRIGTAEIYRQVERLPEVIESLVIGQDWQNDTRVVLFVKLSEGLMLDEGFIARIKQTIRENTTMRHVPAKIVQVEDIPRTKSGKIVELAVRNIVHSLPVRNLEALSNPEALEHFRDRAELQTD